MSGGGAKSQQTYTPPPVYRPVNAPEIPTTGYGGMGYYSVPNPFIQGSKPSWMQGHFDMPSWGMDAVTGQPLTQAQLQAPQPPPPAPAPAPLPPAAAGKPTMEDLFRQAWGPSEGDTRWMEDAGFGVGSGAYRGMFNPMFAPMLTPDWKQPLGSRR